MELYPLIQIYPGGLIDILSQKVEALGLIYKIDTFTNQCLRQGYVEACHIVDPISIAALYYLNCVTPYDVFQSQVPIQYGR